jgi:acetyl esterase
MTHDSHAGADPEVRRLISTLAERGPGIADIRAAFRDFVRRVEAEGGPRPEIARIADGAVAGPAGPIPVRLYEPHDRPAATSDAFVFLHGGGWAIGDLDTGDLGARALAAGLAMRVISVDYRLAPEHPFPAGLDDCMAVVRAAIAGTSGSVYVGGESAGANLSAVAAMLCRDEGLRLAGQFLINPGVDLLADTPSRRRLGHSEGLSMAAIAMFTAMYAGKGDAADPRMSPLRAASLAGVAPCFVTTAGFDPLLDEGVAYAQRLIAEGVPVVYLPMPKMMHAWWVLLTASSGAADNLVRMMALARAFVAAHR